MKVGVIYPSETLVGTHQNIWPQSSDLYHLLVQPKDQAIVCSGLILRLHLFPPLSQTVLEMPVLPFFEDTFTILFGLVIYFLDENIFHLCPCTFIWYTILVQISTFHERLIPFGCLIFRCTHIRSKSSLLRPYCACYRSLRVLCRMICEPTTEFPTLVLNLVSDVAIDHPICWHIKPVVTLS